MKKTLTMESALQQINQIELKDRLFMEPREMQLQRQWKDARLKYQKFEMRRRDALNKAAGLRGHVHSMNAHGVKKMVFVDGYCAWAPEVNSQLTSR